MKKAIVKLDYRVFRKSERLTNTQSRIVCVGGNSSCIEV